MDNVIVTAHIAGEPDEYPKRVMGVVAENVARWREGRPLLNVVDPAARLLMAPVVVQAAVVGAGPAGMAAAAELARAGAAVHVYDENRPGAR